MGNGESFYRQQALTHLHYDMKPHDSYCQCPRCLRQKYIPRHNNCWCPMCRAAHHSNCPCDGCMKHNRKFPKQYFDELSHQKCKCNRCGGNLISSANNYDRRARQYATGQHLNNYMMGRGYTSPNVAPW